jgi:hypothetical protein
MFANAKDAHPDRAESGHYQRFADPPVGPSKTGQIPSVSDIRIWVPMGFGLDGAGIALDRF